jgi:predicted nucleotidyltransferase
MKKTEKMKQEFTTELLEDIVAHLKDAIHPSTIYLFGSYASGQANEDSDIDLLVVVPDTQESLQDITARGRRSLWEINFPFDLIVCTKFQFDRFRDVKNSIMNEAFYFGRVIYGS